MDFKHRQERNRSTQRTLRGTGLLLGFFLSLAAHAAPEGAILVRSIIPEISERMPYAGPANFTGHPVPGYGGPHCWLHPLAAEALAKVVREATRAGLTLELYDCYRPQTAVDAFVSWSKNPDEHTKAHFYPRVSKDTLFALGYIALESTHRTGLSIDLGVQGLDFGTPFDFFDPRSGIHAVVSKRAQQNRRRLRVLMETNGFSPYEQEWWHFTLRLEPHPQPIVGDIPP